MRSVMGNDSKEIVVGPVFGGIEMNRTFTIFGVIFLTLLFGCSRGEGDIDQIVTMPKRELDTAVDIALRSTEASEIDYRPFLNGNKKHIAALVISGVWEGFPDYSEVFVGILNGLAEMGWMEAMESSLFWDFDNDKLKEVLEILTLLETGAFSRYVEFSSEYYFDFEWGEKTTDDADFRNLISEISPVDLIISLGTTAGQAFASIDDVPIPVVADSISDPLNSGIITSYEDSGKDYLTVRVDPNRYLRQVRMFYDVVNFGKLGVIYEDTAEGRTYAAIDDVEAVAIEKGFDVVHNTNVLSESAEVEDAESQYLAALNELAPQVDAIYLGITTGLSTRNLPHVMTIINRHAIPSFAMKGSAYVEQGVLFGISESEEGAVGIHNAKNIITILRGTKPRDIVQTFEHVPHIAINLKAAEVINYNVPIDIIASSDEIYRTIE